MIIIDTNVFVALADRRDAHHAECRDWLAGCDEPLIVPPTVLAEACYMIDKYLGAESEAKFLDCIGIGRGYRFQLAELVDADLRRMAELVRRYADRRLGGTDASMIAICERLSITTVATVNRRDFANVQSLGIELLQRATRDDYDRWLNTALAAGGCVRPVRLRGTVRDVDTVTGQVLDGLDTEDLPDKTIYVPSSRPSTWSTAPPLASLKPVGNGATHSCGTSTVLGEAAGRLSEEIKARFPDVAWQQPVRLRNRIVHGYWSIDLGVLHTTASEQLPDFTSELRKVLRVLRSEA